MLEAECGIVGRMSAESLQEPSFGHAKRFCEQDEHIQPLVEHHQSAGLVKKGNGYASWRSHVPPAYVGESAIFGISMPSRDLLTLLQAKSLFNSLQKIVGHKASLLSRGWITEPRPFGFDPSSSFVTPLRHSWPEKPVHQKSQMREGPITNPILGTLFIHPILCLRFRPHF